MKPKGKRIHIGLATVMFAFAATFAFAQDPLLSWNEGPVRNAIVSFVERVTTPGGAEYVPPAERIAVFDNDGTLWGEQPMYVQLLFAIDRVRALAPKHPEWKKQEPFASVLKGDYGAALKGGEKALQQLVMATHAGMTTEEFEQVVSNTYAYRVKSCNELCIGFSSYIISRESKFRLKVQFFCEPVAGNRESIIKSKLCENIPLAFPVYRKTREN